MVYNSPMNHILFATGNARKIEEATVTLRPFDITVEPIAVDIDEIQHRDPADITKAKARAAYEAAGTPVVVSDTSWEIPALGGFPGGYMKDVAAWLSADDWLALMERHDDKRIFCHEHVAYCDGTETVHFASSYEGYFIDEARGREHPEESFERTVSLYGGPTMAERLAEGSIASAGEDLQHWKQFGEWFAARSAV